MPENLLAAVKPGNLLGSGFSTIAKSRLLFRHFGLARQPFSDGDHSPSFLGVAHSAKGSYEPQCIGLMSWPAF